MLNQPRAGLSLLAVAVAAVLGAAGLLSTTGSAQSTGTPRTLHFVATAYGGFEPKGSFHDGTVFGFKERLKTDDGTTGRDVAVCTATDAKHKESLCHIVLIFPNGQLVLEVFHRESTKRIPAAVVGGTGAYAGAHGSAVAKDISEEKTDVTVDLVG